MFAEQFLANIYSHLPKELAMVDNPCAGCPPNNTFNAASDELEIGHEPNFTNAMNNGNWNAESYVQDIWSHSYIAIRKANLFLENIGKVPDLEINERKEWIAEVKFLKAWYHFYLVRMYGPVPIIKENLPIDVDINRVKVYRDPVDSCFRYITQLLDEAKNELPLTISNPAKMLGRITRPIAYSLKAKVLVTAASPLFNGNTDQATLKNNNSVQLFNTTYSKDKWDSAVVACREAIAVCHDAGLALYEYRPNVQQYKLTDTTTTQLSIRNVFTERWNSEIIWANTQSIASLIQRVATPNVDHRYIDNPASCPSWRRR